MVASSARRGRSLGVAKAGAAEAQAERARRELARRQMLAFAQYVAPWFVVARHQAVVAEALNQVAEYIVSRGQRGIGRLMVFMPPRHGKTELVARMFPAWLLGRMPDARVILTSYGADLAQKSSRAVRNLLAGPAYQAVFGALSAVEPVQLADDSRSVASWELAAPHRGGLLAAGVGGGITGAGAHLAIVDDPFKNREEAESESRRDLVWDWFGSSLYTRLEDGAAMVVMHTRWHPDDLAGRLLKAMANDPLAEQWTVINLPALAYQADDLAGTLADGVWLARDDALGRKPGEALWPAKFDAETLARMKAMLDNINPLDWNALYQQQPRAMEGAFFQRDYWRVTQPASVPAGLQWARYVDLALSGAKTADFNATAAVALADDGTLYVRDMVRVRGWEAFRPMLKALMLSDTERGTLWGIEDVAFQALVFQELLRDADLLGVQMVTVRPEGDKVLRARPVQTRGLAGKLALVDGPWVTRFVSEALEFPQGRHDDQIDTVSGGLGMLAARGKAGF